jgi:hypothetical protein
MVRLKVLVSAVPLVVAAILARGELMPSARPCIAIGDTSMQIASLPWQAQFQVSFTDDPAAATVRVQTADSAEAADFTVVDDVDGPQDDACEVTASTRFVAISTNRPASGPVIYLTPDGPADYRIFVRSKRFTPRAAAALIVGARRHPLEAASL